MRYNLSKIKGKTAYSKQEVANLFFLNRKTVSRWLKEGLMLLDPSSSPKLIMGHDLKAFLKAKRETKRTKLSLDQFYCLRCRKAVLAKDGSEQKQPTGKRIGNAERYQDIVRAKCKECNASIVRIF